MAIRQEVLETEELYLQELGETPPLYQYVDRTEGEYLKDMQLAILSGKPIPTVRSPIGVFT